MLRSQLKETNERLDALEQRVDRVELQGLSPPAGGTLSGGRRHLESLF